MSDQRTYFLLIVVLLSGCALNPHGSNTQISDAASSTAGNSNGGSGSNPTDTSTNIPDITYVPDVWPDAPLETPCTDGESLCDDDALELCADGVWQVSESCALGCHERQLRCLAFVPSNVPSEVAQLMETVTAELVVDSSVTLDTDKEDEAAAMLGEAVSYAVVEQDNGPELCVLAMASLDIRPGATLRAVGSRALVLLVSGEVSIAGTLDVGGYGNQPGAGGGDVGQSSVGSPEACAGGDGEGEGYRDSGGGGGGHGGAGGFGGQAGSGEDVASRGAAGEAHGNDDLTPLRGGCGGGNGSGSRGGDSSGGAGGGAVQVSSATAVRVTGIGGIAAGGGGGAGGRPSHAGGGGGAGGAVLIEAPLVEIENNVIIAANGGGGGGGGTNIEAGIDGPDGGFSFVESPGGAAGAGGTGSDGAAGGFYKTHDGNSALPAIFNAGGGGGSVGRIRINTGPEGFNGGIRLTPQGALTASQGAVQAQ
jgi:hypothetical protein